MTGPALSPVRRRDLAVVAVGLAVAAWVLVRAFYGVLPPLHWYLSVPVGLLALAEALGARTLRARLAAERELRARPSRGAVAGAPTIRPVEPMLVARVAVLAQASAYVGAVTGGIWAGVLAYVGPAVGRLESASRDTVTAVLGLLVAAGLLAAALWLESVCRIPPSHDEEPAEQGYR
jgi:hypothetical protein